jgi:putative transposase
MTSNDLTEVGGLATTWPVVARGSLDKWGQIRAEFDLARDLLGGPAMSIARQVVPGCTYLITRRTQGRTFLLRPDRRVEKFYLYCLAVYAEHYGIQVHLVVLMSNHEHLIVTDPYGRLPDFLRDFHRAVALGIKIIHKWDGEVWDGAPTSCVTLCTPKAIIEKLAYVMANPVEAGLVQKAEDWPGIMVLPEQLGVKTWTIQRPEIFFDPDNPQWPKEATLRLTMPKHYLPDDEVRSQVAVQLTKLQAEARARLQAEGRRVLGREAVLAMSPQARAKRREAIRSPNPTLAVGRGQKMAFVRAVAALRTFRRKYYEALEQWRQGIRDVLFPKYTWQMSWLHRVQTEPG